MLTELSNHQTITLKDFIALTKDRPWIRSQTVEFVDENIEEEFIWNGLFGEECPRRFKRFTGIGTLTSTLESIIIRYQEIFYVDEFTPESLELDPDGMDPDQNWTSQGVTVVNEDGEPVGISDLIDSLSDDFKAINYDHGLDIQKELHADVQGSAQQRIQIDKGPLIIFSGELISKTWSSGDNSIPQEFSGKPGHFTELYLYKTISGRYVYIQDDCCNGKWITYGEVCDTFDELRCSLGCGWLANELFENAGL
jgi:hypothetical protein